MSGGSPMNSCRRIDYVPEGGGRASNISQSLRMLHREQQSRARANSPAMDTLRPRRASYGGAEADQGRSPSRSHAPGTNSPKVSALTRWRDMTGLGTVYCPQARARDGCPVAVLTTATSA